jgi:DNA (cytosine-5)-methyltransferase 1
MCLNGKNGKRYDGESETFVAHTLRAEGHDASEDGTGRGTPLTVAYQCHGSNVGEMGTLRQGNGNESGGVPFCVNAVRRLTPRECERLQGFPDDWTRYCHDGKEISDSARYRMLGNAVTVNVAEWIGRRILAKLKDRG